MNKRVRKRKRIIGRIKVPLAVPASENDTWSMDFMHDVLMNGRKFRTLNIIDDFNREALAVDAYYSIGSKRVTTVLDRIIRERGIPRTQMKSLHYWFLVSCVSKGVKSSLRFISNLFLFYWEKNRFAPFLTFFGLIGEYQVYREYQEFTKNTRNTHEIALLFPIFWSVTESIVPSLHFQFSNLIFSYQS